MQSHELNATSAAASGPVESDHDQPDRPNLTDHLWESDSDPTEAPDVNAEDIGHDRASECPEGNERGRDEPHRASNAAETGDSPNAPYLMFIKECIWGRALKNSEKRYKTARKQVGRNAYEFEKLRSEYYKLRTASTVQHLAEETGDIGNANKLASCGLWKRYQRGLSSGKCRLNAASFCQLYKLCPVCSRRRSKKTVFAYVDKTIELIRQSGAIPYMVTLTTKNEPDLMQAVNRMRAALQTMKEHRKNYAKGNSQFSEWCRFTDAAWHLEIKRSGRSGLWHPHYHGIVLVPKSQFHNISRRVYGAFDFNSFCAEWSKRTGLAGRPNIQLTDAAAIVFKHGERVTDNPDRLRELLLKPLLEVFKYPLKFDQSMNEADAIEIWQKTKRMRFLQSWGGYYGCKPPKSLVDDPITDELFETICLRWSFEQAKYIERRRYVTRPKTPVAGYTDVDTFDCVFNDGDVNANGDWCDGSEFL